jgi:hypothetical protein
LSFHFFTRQKHSSTITNKIFSHPFELERILIWQNWDALYQACDMEKKKRKEKDDINNSQDKINNRVRKEEKGYIEGVISFIE